ncbi:MAG TPA: endonuclease Q family protein [Clostridia bacterium]|nr:endonuclease Q family protein [Clostridia bacterium]
MKEYYVDLHVHIGRSSMGREVKKATASDLTFENIAHEAYYRKGIQVIGVVDCVSPYIVEDIELLQEKGEITEREGGGMDYRGGLTLILGGEIETHEAAGCSAHSLCFFPTLGQLKSFSAEFSKHVKNMRSCSYMSRLTGQELFNLVNGVGGLFIPAHVFSPHKSFYGNCCSSLHEIFDGHSFSGIPCVELGLSADAAMADMLGELSDKTFISNSDAHSLMKMGREYNVFRMAEPSFKELLLALENKAGRTVLANYGLDPRLGKYHRSFCITCGRIIDGEPPVLSCPVSASHQVVVGVRDRIEVIRDRETPVSRRGTEYHYQVPLEFLPGVGPKTIDRLIGHFGNEMNVLHKATEGELKHAVKESIAEAIILAREGRIGIGAGGGGIYGRVEG